MLYYVLFNISDYLYLANLSIATSERLYSKITQIDNYDWLSDDIVNRCYQNLDSVVGEECRSGKWSPEKNIIRANADEDHIEIDQCLSTYFGKNMVFRFSARVDLVTETTIWEMKCTNQITIEHMLQVVIYAWIWKMMYENTSLAIQKKKSAKQFKLFNIRTGELWELKATKEELTQIVVELLRGKNISPTRKTDEEFLQEMNILL
jgi:hypothetical protein